MIRPPRATATRISLSIALIGLSIGLWAAPVRAQDPSSATPAPGPPDASAAPLAAAAGELFAAGAYAEAASAYQALVDEDPRDAAIYHNLGHAWYRQRNYGRAVLAYSRAARLAPRDARIRASLALARRRAAESAARAASGLAETSVATTGAMPSEPAANPGQQLASGGTAAPPADLAGPDPAWFDLLGSRLTRSELAGLVLALWWLCALCIVLARHRRAGRARQALRLIAATSAAGMAIGALAWGAWTYDVRAHPRAVVILPEVQATSGPGPDLAPIAALPPGSTVRLLETRGHFARVALPDGREGWVAAEAVERVE